MILIADVELREVMTCEMQVDVLQCMTRSRLDHDWASVTTCLMARAAHAFAVHFSASPALLFPKMCAAQALCEQGLLRSSINDVMSTALGQSRLSKHAISRRSPPLQMPSAAA